jgi:hypothetical protein
VGDGGGDVVGGLEPAERGLRTLDLGVGRVGREQRRSATAEVRDRLARGQTDGDVPPGADIGALAAYVSTVQFGMSLQARDGANREELSAVVDQAMVAVGQLVRPTA